VIAATHQDLEQRVKEGVFREDLFHRLNVIRLRLPPLRERREDIPGLARHFLQRSAKELGVESKRLSDAALAMVVSFDFPGNVRQLENLCHWLTVMAPAQTVDPKDLPPEVQATAHGVQPAPAGSGALAYAHGLAAPGTSAAAPTHGAAAHGAPAELPLTAGSAWLTDLDREARTLLEHGQPEVWDHLTRQFEARLIQTALTLTKGRRIEAAHKLGIGRNTITRKIQELRLEG
jgi:two-component system nitrogen regulation response regulator GlnG